MGILGDIGAPGFLSEMNLAGAGSKLLILVAIVLIVIIVGGGAFFYYSKKSKKQQFKNKVPMFVEINGKRTRTGMDLARELFVPDSNISLYFLKKKKIYLPRPTRAMGKDEYWYSISPNGEWVNFDLAVDSEQNTLSQANYDHRDTRYAYVNLKDIIKKNYKDKAIKWWKEYSHVISFIIIAFVMVIGCWLLIAKIGNLIEAITPLLKEASKFQGCPGSGVLQG